MREVMLPLPGIEGSSEFLRENINALKRELAEYTMAAMAYGGEVGDDALELVASIRTLEEVRVTFKNNGWF